MPDWYLIHTKPRQERIALLNLEQQGFACYMPMMALEKVLRGVIGVADEPLFPRYIFIQLATEMSSKSWSPIRSTRGVNRLVSFGNQPAKVDEHLVQALRAHEKKLNEAPRRWLEAGESVLLVEGAFAGVEGIFQMTDPEGRALVLIEMMCKPVQIKITPGQLRAVA